MGADCPSCEAEEPFFMVCIFRDTICLPEEKHVHCWMFEGFCFFGWYLCFNCI